MSEVQNNVNAYEDEIDLRELIMALWRSKYIIVSIALVLAVLVGLYSMFILSPVYQARLNIVINMPEQFHTRYGDYALPITSNQEYIQLITTNQVLKNTIKEMGYDVETASLEGLRGRISIQDTKDAKQNFYEVKVSAGNPQEALKLAQTLFDNYIEFVDIMTKERAIEYYVNFFRTDILSQEIALKSKMELLQKHEELLAVTPQIINQKDAMQEAEQSLGGSIDYIVLENVINPNYTSIENKIITLQQEIYTIEDKIREYNENLMQLEEERQIVAQYYETGEEGDQRQPSLIGIVKTSIYLPSQPVVPSRKSSPSTSRNAVIGLVIGLMLGFIVAYIKEFWIKPKKQ